MDLEGRRPRELTVGGGGLFGSVRWRSCVESGSGEEIWDGEEGESWKGSGIENSSRRLTGRRVDRVGTVEVEVG